MMPIGTAARRLARGVPGRPDSASDAAPPAVPTRCYLATAGGRVLFDAADDVGLARELPQEAFRRFRSDLQRRKERNLQRRAVQRRLARREAAPHRRMGRHASHGRAAGAVRGRRAACRRSVEALTDEAFSALKDQPRYPLDGPARLQAYLRAATGRVT